MSELKIAELRHKAPPRSGQTMSGYGVAVPTSRMVRLEGSAVWRRVYCTIFSNVGTCWVRVGKKKHVVRGFSDAPAELWDIDSKPWGEEGTDG